MGGVIFDNRISEKFVTASKLAEHLSVSIHTIRKWRKYKMIPYHKVGRSLRFRVSEVLTALEGDQSK
jgi:excisionase family DNA binding protein